MRKKLPSASREANAISRLIVHVSVFTLLFILSLQFAFAQLQLLKDVNKAEETSYNEYSSLTHGVGRMYYVSENELWKSNGTPESTLKLKAFESIANLTMVGTTLYFSADDGVSGVELWRSNGTPGNTVRVKDIMEGAEGSSPHNLTAVDSMLFFAAHRQTGGVELWRSDGTSTGTAMVKDIASGSSSPRNMVDVNGILFFSATDGVNGHELWKSDGTAANTVMVKNIYAGKSNAYPEQLTAYNGKLYFTVYEPATGRELWVSDGTSVGTVQLKDIRPGSQSSTPENLIVIKDKLIFTAHDGQHGDELWKTDGSVAGTAMVKDMNPGGAGSNSTVSGLPMRAFSNMNGVLYFIAAKGDKEYIYRSDGTDAGTIILKQANGMLGDPPQPAFTYMNGYVYFFDADHPFFESQALRRIPYKGAPGQISTVRYFDGPFSWYAATHPVRNEMIHFYNNLYFFGRFSVNDDIYGGFEFIRSDGTFEGCVSVFDNFIPTEESIPREMIRAGNIVYMNQGSPLSYTPPLYRTDGTPSGTFQLVDERYHLDWEPVGNQLYFLTDDTNGYDGFWYLSRTDGTHTYNVTSGGTTDSPTLPYLLTGVNGVLYYTNDNGELWRSEGTHETTVMVKKFDRVQMITSVGGAALLLGSSGGDLALWKSTTTGFVRIYSFGTNQQLGYGRASGGGVQYFTLGSRDTGAYQIWRTDGTSGGTYKVGGANGYDGSSDWAQAVNTRLMFYNGTIYFSGLNESGSYSLYRVNGQSSITNLGDMPLMTYHAVVNNKLVIFSAEENSVHVYGFDHVNESIVPLATFESDDYLFLDFEVVGDQLYFVTQLDKQLYRTDGTFCGTYKLDIGTKEVYGLCSIGDDLILGAYTLQTGIEPHVYHNINSLPGTPACEDDASLMSASLTSPDQPASENMSYPNPFTSTFKLKLEGAAGDKAEVSVFTIYGLPVETLNDLDTNTEYEVGVNWPVGTYILKVRTQTTSYTHQVRKK